jgi:hypothetical protein
MVPVGIKSIAEKGVAEEGVVEKSVTGGTAKDAIEDSIVENIAKLISGYLAIIIRILIVKVT